MKEVRGTVILAEHRGFCSGVRRALGMVESLLDEKRKLYVLHEIVHNSFVVRGLSERGVRFVDTPEEVPDGERIVFSAHGVPPEIVARAQARRLEIIDATCPLVDRIHQGVRAAGTSGSAVVLIGNAGHPEVEGILGELPGKIHRLASCEEVAQLPEFAPGTRVSVFCQTTLGEEDYGHVLSALRERYPCLSDAGGVCYATRERQDSVRVLAREVDFLIVVGSPHSSNSVRLKKIAEREGTPAILLDDPDALEASTITAYRKLGVTAGASAPECLVTRLVERLQQMGYDQ